MTGPEEGGPDVVYPDYGDLLREITKLKAEVAHLNLAYDMQLDRSKQLRDLVDEAVRELRTDHEIEETGHAENCSACRFLKQFDPPDTRTEHPHGGRGGLTMDEKCSRCGFDWSKLPDLDQVRIDGESKFHLPYLHDQLDRARAFAEQLKGELHDARLEKREGTRGSSRVDGPVAIGDYVNGRFSGTVYKMDRVEHDPGVVSLVLQHYNPTRKVTRQESHVHVNIPTSVLRLVLLAQEIAERERIFYPHDSTLPEVRP